ncbi:MAG: MFS transporter [Rhizobiales bacterium]|nr:MFS transporter [Hyphomicrobiales bacterium]
MGAGGKLDGRRPIDEAGRLEAIVGVVAVVGVYSLTVGYTYPALSFNLEARGYSSTVIGLQTAMSGLGTAFGSFAAAVLVRHFGAWPTVICCMATTVVTIMLFGFIPDVEVWYGLRFILSCSGAVLFVVSETWLNEFAPDRLRGRIVGIYTSVIAGLFAAGPLLIPVIGFSGVFPYVVVGVALAVLGSPVLLLRGRAPEVEHVALSHVARTVRLIPLLLLAVGCFGYFDAAILGLWSVYALGEGISADRAALLLTALIIGNLVLQLPLGYLADRYSRRRLLVVCALVGAGGAAGLPLIDLSSAFAVPYLVVWGALAFGVYTLAMTLVGEHLRGPQLLAANAGFSLMWGVGNLVGAGITGPLMDAIGGDGFPLSIFGAYAALLVAALAMVPVRTAVVVLRQGLASAPPATSDPTAAAPIRPAPDIHRKGE